jgi:hypothetical protein
LIIKSLALAGDFLCSGFFVQAFFVQAFLIRPCVIAPACGGGFFALAAPAFGVLTAKN